MLGLDQVNKNLLIINNFQLQRKKNLYKLQAYISSQLASNTNWSLPITHNLTPTKKTQLNKA